MPAPGRLSAITDVAANVRVRTLSHLIGDEVVMPSKCHQPIPGTTIFDGTEAQKGYALNKMCYSFNDAANRRAFLEDEAGYCARFGLTESQRRAVANRDVLALIAAGGNIYYLAKLAGIFQLNVQDIGAQQTGLSLAEFKAKLVAAGG
jgi:protocatechuate 4,5-dioxygenase alpha chain